MGNNNKKNIELDFLNKNFIGKYFGIFSVYFKHIFSIFNVRNSYPC